MGFGTGAVLLAAHSPLKFGVRHVRSFEIICLVVVEGERVLEKDRLD